MRQENPECYDQQTLMQNIRYCSNIQTPNTGTSSAALTKRIHKRVNSQNMSQLTTTTLHKDITSAFNIKRTERTLKTLRMKEVEDRYNELLKLRQALMVQYKSLMEFYETNEEKLRRIMGKQLKENAYFYSKEVMAFIKQPNHKIITVLKCELFKHDLIAMTQFLGNFNARKKIKQVEIIKETMLNRETMIRNSSSYEEYQEIYLKMRKPLRSSGYTIYDQYKSIKMDYNLPMNHEGIHERLYNKMCEAEESLNNVMKREVQKKQGQFHLLALHKG